MDSSIFTTCQASFPDGDGTKLLQCISDSLQAADDSRKENLHDFLFVISGAMIFFMQAGFASLCAGAVRIKNVQNTMLKNLLDACGAAFAFFLVGECKNTMALRPFQSHANIFVYVYRLCLCFWWPR